jgi:hypothetical protein
MRESRIQIANYELPRSVTKTDDGWQVDCIGFVTRRG